MSDKQDNPKKNWDDSVSNYVAKLQAGSSLHPMYAKAGLTQDHTAQAASAMLYEIGIDIAASDLTNGGTFYDKDDISVYHAKKDRWYKGRTSQKGFVQFHNDGGPVIARAINYPNGEELRSEVVTLEMCAKHVPGFSMDMINAQGWLKPEYVPSGNESAPVITIDPEARALQDAQRKEQRAKDEADRRQKRLNGAKTVKAAIDKSVEAHAKVVASGNNIEPHGNHAYLKRKYGDDLPQYAPYLKSLIASDITFASWAKPDEIYPLYQPGYDILTGQMTALQRTSHDAIPDKVPGKNGKTNFIKQYDENGSPKIVKKFASGTNANNAATPVFNAPSDDIKTFFIAEGYTTGVRWARAMDMANNPNAKDFSVLSCYNAANIPKVAADLRVKHPKANLVIIADNDWQTPNNDGQKYANEAREESGAIVVTPPVSYLKDGQSDWDDVGKNIQDALTIEAQKEHGPNAKASFESSMDVLKRIIEAEYLQALNSVIEEADVLIKQATEKVSERENSSLPIAKHESMMLAIQDPEFKNLTSAAFKVAGVLDHSKDWTMPKTVSSLLNNIDFDDSALKALNEAQRRQVLKDSSAALVEVLTENKSHNSMGHENKMVITELSKVWDVSANYTKAFLGSLDANVESGRQRINSPEPVFITEFTHKLIETYRNQNMDNSQKAELTAQNTSPTQEVPAVEQQEQSKVARRTP